MAHFHILGAGSIGTVFAYHLALRGNPVTLLLRSSTKLHAFQAAGSRLTIESQLPQGVQIGATAVTGEHVSLDERSTAPIRNILVTTKANHAVSAVAAVRHRLEPSSVVVLLQNGVLGVYQELIAELFSDPSSRPVFLLGSTTHGAYRKGHFHTAHVGQGTCGFGFPPGVAYYGSLQVQGTLQPSSCQQQQQEGSPNMSATATEGALQQTQPLDQLGQQQQQRAAEVLSVLGSVEALSPNVALTPEQLEQQLLLKLVINCAANPLTALLHCKNGGLLNNPAATELMQQVVSECRQVFGIKLQGSEQELLTKVQHVVGFNANNYNSMLQDVVAGHHTEIKYLNGYVVHEGRQMGLPCPANSMLCRLVEAREGVEADMRTHESLGQH